MRQNLIFRPSHISETMSQTTTSGIQGATVGNRFLVGRKLGAGSFGELYAAVDLTTSTEVALKTEPVRGRYPQLHYESRVYKALAGGGIILS
jgi:serine/threonine protein kinase